MKEKTSADNQRAKREILRRREIHRSIVHAAEKVILTKGYTGMTMDDVANGAGLSKATLYKYIPSKERILFEIVGRYLDEEEERVRRVVDSGDQATEKLRMIITGTVHFQRVKSNIGHIMMMDKSTIKFMRLIFEKDGKARGERLRRNINILKLKNMDIIKLAVRVIEQGVASGEFRPVDPMETVFFISSLLDGINHNWFWKSRINAMPEDELAERIFVFVYSSLCKRSDNGHTRPFQYSEKKFMDAPEMGRKEL